MADCSQVVDYYNWDDVHRLIRSDDPESLVLVHKGSPSPNFTVLRTNQDSRWKCPSCSKFLRNPYAPYLDRRRRCGFTLDDDDDEPKDPPGQSVLNTEDDPVVASIPRRMVVEKEN